MNLIGCLDTPSKGSYLLNGKQVSQMNDNELARIRNEEIGFVFQTFNLLPRATALHNVELPLIYAGVPSKDAERGEGGADKVELDDAHDAQAERAVGGQRQRVAIARALVNNPSILLADEPTGNLDSKTGVEIMALFERCTGGNTIVLVTHEPDVAATPPRHLHPRRPGREKTSGKRPSPVDPDCGEVTAGQRRRSGAPQGRRGSSNGSAASGGRLHTGWPTAAPACTGVGGGEEVRAGASLDDPAAIHHRDPIADVLDQAQVVRDEQVGQLQRSCSSSSRLTTCAWTETSSADTGSSAMTSDGLSASARARPMR
jgi:putative ABC transport system ATP-binding protein